MPELAFRVQGAEPRISSQSPAVLLRLEIANWPPEQEIRSIALVCQVQIEAARRRYSDREKERLRDLFGEPESWGQTLRSLLWANVRIAVPEFTGTTEVEIALPCAADPVAGTAKYFSGLENAPAPLILLFSGTVFYDAGGGRLQIAPISWNSEARFLFPVEVWMRALETGAAWTAR